MLSRVWIVAGAATGFGEVRCVTSIWNQRRTCFLCPRLGFGRCAGRYGAATGFGEVRRVTSIWNQRRARFLCPRLTAGPARAPSSPFTTPPPTAAAAGPPADAAERERWIRCVAFT